MGAQQDVGSSVDEEGVLHIAGGVVFGEVERGEYMPVVFDFGAFGNVKSEAAENGDDFLADERQGVARAESDRRGGACEIYA